MHVSASLKFLNHNKQQMSSTDKLVQHKQKSNIMYNIKDTLMTYLALTASLLNVTFVLLVNTDSEADNDDDDAALV